MEIAADMLEAARKGARKTSIMYRTNLSYKLLVAYMSVLRENQLLETTDELVFYPTKKGHKFLKEFREMRELQDNYAQTDPADGRKYLTVYDGTRSYFPKRIPKTVRFRPSDSAKSRTRCRGRPVRLRMLAGLAASGKL